MSLLFTPSALALHTSLWDTTTMTHHYLQPNSSSTNAPPTMTTMATTTTTSSSTTATIMTTSLSHPRNLSKRKSASQIQPPHEPAHKKRLAYRRSSQQASTSFSSTRFGPSSDTGLSSVASVNRLQDNLDFLLDEWTHIDIVLNSVRNAFPVQPLESSSEEHLDEVDRELSIAYDDLMAQVRHLDRSLRRLDTEMDSLRQTKSKLPKSVGRNRHHSSSRAKNPSPPMRK